MNCLVIGYGLLGKKLAEKLHENGISFSIASDDVTESDGERLDITDPKAVESLIKKKKPDVVFLTAALSNVDSCEQNSEIAFRVNVEGPKNVAAACKKHESQLVFYSSDFVFDGKKGNYSELDKPNPLNVYGKSKLLAEKAINEILPKCLIIRTSTLFGSLEASASGKKKSFVQFVFESLKKGEQISVVTDQKTNPTLVDDLVAASIELAKREHKGIFNVAGATAVSREQFAAAIAERFSLKKELIKPVSSKQLRQAAERPLDSSLSLRKLNSLGIETKSLEHALAELSEP